MTNSTEVASPENPSKKSVGQATRDFFSKWSSDVSIISGIATTGTGSLMTGLTMGHVPTSLSIAEGGATAIVAFATSMQVILRNRKNGQ